MINFGWENSVSDHLLLKLDYSSSSLSLYTPTSVLAVSATTMEEQARRLSGDINPGPVRERLGKHNKRFVGRQRPVTW